MARGSKTAAVAEAAPSTPREIKRQAVQRLYQRRRPAEFRTAVGVGPLGKDLRVWLRGGESGGDREFPPPEDLPSWCDDMAARLPLREPYDVIVRQLSALREGEKAGVAAVALARDLKPWNRHVAWSWWQDTPLPPQAPADAAGPLNAVRAEWRRLRLDATRAAAERDSFATPVLNQADLDANADRTRRNAPAIPAGLKV